MKTVTLILVLFGLQSYEETVQKLADDLVKAETPSAKVGVGDEYTKLLKKYPKKRQEILDAASEAYGRGWPDLDPFWRTKTREHLAKLYVPVVPGRGGFPDGWSGPVDGAHKASVASERVHSGGSAAKLVPGAKARNARLLATPKIEGPGKKVEFSIWVLSDGTDLGSDEVRFYLDGTVASVKIPKDTPVWTKLTKEFDTVGGSFTNAQIEVVVFSREGVVFADDLSVKVDGKELLKGGGFEK